MMCLCLSRWDMDFSRIVFFSFVKQVKEFLRYPNYLIKSFFYTPIAYVLPLYYFLSTLTEQTSNTLIFETLICMVVWQYISFTFVETCNIAKRELNIGILDVMFTLPVKSVYWVIGNILAPNILFLLSNSLLVFVGFLVFDFTFSISGVKLLFLLIVVFIEVLIFSIFIYFLVLLFKKVLNIVLMLLELIFLVTGVIYPLCELPVLLKLLGVVSPFSYVFQILRGEKILSGFVICNIGINIVYCGLIVVFYRKTIRGMKINGNLSNY